MQMLAVFSRIFTARNFPWFSAHNYLRLVEMKILGCLGGWLVHLFRQGNVVLCA